MEAPGGKCAGCWVAVAVTALALLATGAQQTQPAVAPGLDVGQLPWRSSVADVASAAAATADDGSDGGLHSPPSAGVEADAVEAVSTPSSSTPSSTPSSPLTSTPSPSAAEEAESTLSSTPSSTPSGTSSTTPSTTPSSTTPSSTTPTTTPFDTPSGTLPPSIMDATAGVADSTAYPERPPGRSYAVEQDAAGTTALPTAAVAAVTVGVHHEGLLVTNHVAAHQHHATGHAVSNVVSGPVSGGGQAHHNPCHHGHQRPPRCETSLHGYRMDVFCSGGVHKVSRSRSHKAKTANVTLVLCFWPEDTFDPDRLTSFPRLHRLEVVDSNVTEVLDFPYHDHLEELILAGLRLTWLADDVFSGLRRLRLLDIRRNHLATLSSATLLRPPSLRRVMLAGNPWRCTLALSWMAELQRVTLVDADAMQCGAALHPRRPVMTVVALLKRVAAECPVDDACACELTRLVRDARGAGDGQEENAGELVPIITVNCSQRGLEAMPATLPANTTTLLLRDNKITSVRPLVDKHVGVLDVYLDNNAVESIDDLEGSPWLDNFRVLSLRANKLQQLPTYALDNALVRNEHAVRVYLGLNPWRCDCQFMPSFQELLAKYKSLIADWDDIRCAEVDGDDNSMKKIHGLSRSAVCREEPQVTALDLVNGALATALAAVLAKLAYDYWRYRRYGRLPWIATKLP